MSRWEPNARGRLEQAVLDLYQERGFEQTMVTEILPVHDLSCGQAVGRSNMITGIWRVAFASYIFTNQHMQSFML
ncbi:hypothetical protein KDI_19130 [Dictyobacter arantiisoli]|uniref:Uncharacterized protein n=1 Tax=Dictyobacter arantiisoli TaxID=2014874 RepID=A0A5A5TBH2_9CHLR|nr:hypothetical protein KDI_19130 [Dictyobacter arantiisoli]